MNHSVLFSTLAFLALVPHLFATPPLSTQEEIDAAFKNSDLIFRGKIVATSSQWLCDDQEITEEKAREIEDAFLKHNEEHKEKFGVENEDADAVAHREAWRKTALGLMFMGKIDGVQLVTVKFESPVKGDFSKLGKFFRLAWHSGILQTCSHVGISTEVGDEVVVFLRPDWEKSAPVLSERFFLMGSSALKPTHGEPDAAGQPATQSRQGKD